MTIELTPAYLASQGLSPSFPKRFWSKVDKNGPIQPHRTELGPCWVWTAYKNPAGYGRIGSKGKHGVPMNANRGAWILTRGPIPEGLFVLHHCDFPPCVNPHHLWLGNDLDNVTDMIKKGRGLKGEEHSNSKLNEATVREIRHLHEAGVIMRLIADKFCVNRITVFDVIHRRTWAHC